MTTNSCFKQVLRFLAPMAFVLAAACGGGAVEDFCSKFDECNLLPAGQSAADCEDLTDAFLDNATSSQRSDCEDDLADCNDNESCINFGDCVARNPAFQCHPYFFTEG